MYTYKLLSSKSNSRLRGFNHHYNKGDMADRSNCIARRTRYQFKKCVDEYYEKKEREKAKITNAEEEKAKSTIPIGGKLDGKGFKRRRREAVKICAKGGDDGEARDSDIEILSPIGGHLERKQKLKNHREAVKMGANGSDDGNGSDGATEVLSPISGHLDRKHKLNKRKRQAVTLGRNGGDGSERCERGAEILSPSGDLLERKQELNKRRRESVQMCPTSGDDDDEEIDSDIEILGEEFVPHALRFWRPSRRGRNGKMVSEMIDIRVSSREHSRNDNEQKEKHVQIDDSNSEPSTEGEANDFDDEDYKVDESASSQTQSIASSSCSDNELEGGEDRGDSKAMQVKRCLVEERENYNEDEGRLGTRIVNNEQRNDDSRSTLMELEPMIKVQQSIIALKAGNVHEGSKKRVLGLDVWVDDNLREEASRSRLDRLRPRSISKSLRKKLLRGQISNPVNISESEDSDASSDERTDDDDLVPKKSKKSSRDNGKLSKRKTCAPKNFDFIKILVDSIWEKDDALKEKFSPPEEVTLAQNILPLKFRLEDEDPAPQEIDEWQKEIDNLFSDLEMGLTESEIGSTKLSLADNDDITTMATNPTERCQLGYHHLILREPIGIICKYCMIIYEMKYILPKLGKETWGTRDWMGSRTGDSFIFDRLQFGNSACKNNSATVHAKGSVLDLIPADFRRSLYPHQCDGFEFLWKNLAGETLIENLKTPLPDGGTGCIVSHAPGTGKTCLTIVFLLTFMEFYPTCRPVILAPRTMLLSWAEEFRKWNVNIPFHNLNDLELSGKENAIATSILGRVGNGKRARNYVRMVKLYSWTKDRSILGIGYHLFEKLAGEHEKEGHDERVRKILLELPGLLVLDEGHTPRNDQSLMWKALTKVETHRRIILSGTPFQNNFDELYNTLCLVNPKFDEYISSERCIDSSKIPGWRSNVAKSKWASLINSIDSNADNALEDLKALIDPFVHVHKGTILQESLPGLKDTLVFLRPTVMQKDLIQRIPSNLGRLEKAYIVSLISVHPSLAGLHKYFSAESRLGKLESKPDDGVKTEFVIEITRLSNARGEKVLVFSEYIEPLNFIMKQLTCYFSWTEGKELLYMDGKLDEKHRQISINCLNNPNSEVKVLLASTRACSEGINLVGASRVVLLDVVWNPSVERQAISRAYRLGQKKVVYIYHLITFGTMEVEKYARQFKKDRLSELVFSSPDGQNNKSEISRTISDDKILEAIVQHPKLNRIFEKILDQPKESNLFENFNFVELQQ